MSDDIVLKTPLVKPSAGKPRIVPSFRRSWPWSTNSSFSSCMGGPEHVFRVFGATIRPNVLFGMDYSASTQPALSKNPRCYGARETLASVANLVAWGEIVMPLTAIYPFSSVRDG